MAFAKPLADIVPRDQQLIGRRRDRVVGFRIREARVRLLDELVGLRRRVLFFDNDEGQIAIAGQVVEEGRRA